jgi:hypothetical protein
MNGPLAYRPSLADVRGVRQMEISERSLAARRPHGRARAPNKFGAASKCRQLSAAERRAVEEALNAVARE